MAQSPNGPPDISDTVRSGGRRAPSILQLVGYGAPGMPLAMLLLPLYVYVPTVYAVDLGLGFTAVTVALVAARLWDGISDPLIGWASDRTGGWAGRLGRRRPWTVLGVPLLAAGTWAVFMPGPDMAVGSFLVWLIVLYLGWTMIVVPHQAWGAELAGDYHGRSRVFAYREAAILVGTVVALALPTVLGVGDADQSTAALGVLGIAILVLIVPTVAMMVLVTPDVPPARAGDPIANSYRPRELLRALSQNRPFRQLLTAYFVNAAANGIPPTLFLLYVEFGLDSGPAAGPLLLTYFLAGIVGVPIWTALSRRFGKKQTWITAMLITCAIFSIVPAIPAGNVALFAFVCIVNGFTLGADLVLPSSMQADVIARDAEGVGQSRAGVFFAVWGMATKGALALAAALTLPVLDLVGFSAADGGGGTRELLVLAVLYSWIPVILKLFAVVLVLNYRLPQPEFTRPAVEGRV